MNNLSHSSFSLQGRLLKDAEWRKRSEYYKSPDSAFQIFDGATEQTTTYLSSQSTRVSEIFTETFNTIPNLSQEYLAIRFQWLATDNFWIFFFCFSEKDRQAELEQD